MLPFVVSRRCLSIFSQCKCSQVVRRSSTSNSTTLKLGRRKCSNAFVTLNSPKYFVTRNQECAYASLAAVAQSDAMAAEHANDSLSSASTSGELYEIERLANELNNKGRTTEASFCAALASVKRSNIPVNPEHVATLLRSCGQMMIGVSRQRRTELAKEAWTVLSQLGIKPILLHYNAILASFLENGYQFSVVDYISDMESNGIRPDGTTFQYLLARYCLVGDMDGAGKILELMRTEEFPISDYGFSALLYGYSKNGDEAGVSSILEIMRSNDMKVASHHYCSVATPHAEAGSIEKIRQVAESAAKASTPFTKKDVHDLVLAASLNNQSSIVADILALSYDKSTYRFSETLTSIRLLASEKFADVFAILRASADPNHLDADATANGDYPIWLKRSFASILSTDLPPELVTKFLDYLENNDFGRSYEAALLALLQQGNIDSSIMLIDAISRKHKDRLREPFTYPLFVQMGKARNYEAIGKLLLRINNDFGMAIRSWELESFLWVYMSNGSSSHTDNEFLAIIRNTPNIPAALANKLLSSFVIHKLDNGDGLSIITALDGRPGTKLQNRAIVTALVRFWQTNADAKVVAKVLSRYVENDYQTSVGSRNINSDFLLRVLAATPSETFLALLREMAELNLRISTEAAAEILRASSSRSTDNSLRDGKQHLSDVLNTLQKPDVLNNIPDNSAETIREEVVTVESLEKQLARLKSSGNSTKTILRQLVLENCKLNKADGAEKYYKELKNTYSSSSFSSLANEIIEAVNSLPDASTPLTNFALRLREDAGITTYVRRRGNSAVRAKLLFENTDDVASLEQQLKHVKQNDLNPKVPLKMLVSACCREGDATKASLYYDELKATGVILRRDYFLVIEKSASEKGQPTAEMNTFLARVASELNIRPARQQTKSSKSVITPNLTELTTLAQLEDALKAVDINGGNINPILQRLVAVHCQEKDFEKALKCFKRLKTLGVPIRRSTASAILLHSGNDATSSAAKELLKEIRSDPTLKLEPSPAPKRVDTKRLEAELEELQKNNRNSHSVLRRLILIHCENDNIESAEKYCKELINSGGTLSWPNLVAAVHQAYQRHNNGIGAKAEAAKRLHNMVERSSATSKANTIPNRNSDSTSYRWATSHLSFADSSEQKVLTTSESVRSEIEQMKERGMNVKAGLRHLAAIYATENNAAGALQVYNELQSLNIEFSESLLRSLIAVTVRDSRKENAESIKQLTEITKNYLRTANIVGVYKLAEEFSRAGQIKEALYVVSCLRDRNSEPVDPRTLRDVRRSFENISNNCVKFDALNAAISVIDIGISGGFLQSVNDRIEHILNAFINKDDLIAAASWFATVAKKYGTTPCSQKIMCELIKRTDAQLLQKVFDGCQDVHGEEDAKFRLVMALCACNKIDQATKVLKGCDTPTPKKAMDSEFAFYKNPEVYENLARACRQSQTIAIDRNHVNETLLNIYRKNENWSAALSFWKEIENDKTALPSMTTLRLVAQILTTSQQPLPPEIELWCRTSGRADSPNVQA